MLRILLISSDQRSFRVRLPTVYQFVLVSCKLSLFLIFLTDIKMDEIWLKRFDCFLSQGASCDQRLRQRTVQRKRFLLIKQWDALNVFNNEWGLGRKRLFTEQFSDEIKMFAPSALEIQNCFSWFQVSFLISLFQATLFNWPGQGSEI